MPIWILGYVLKYLMMKLTGIYAEYTVRNGNGFSTAVKQTPKGAFCKNVMAAFSVKMWGGIFRNNVTAACFVKL